MIKSREFSLVLSGGGALGIAHLGVLSDLERANIKPSEIVGTSMGGIIGACYSIGLSEKEIYSHIESFSNIFNWLKFTFDGNSVVSSKKIDEIFVKIFHDRKIKDTSIPLKLVATELESGDVRVFDKDDDILIKDALLATMAIPGIFEPKIINKKVYVDGYLSANLPVNFSSYKQVLASDVLGMCSYDSELPSSRLKIKNIIDMFEKSLKLLIINQTKEAIKTSNKDIKLIDIDTSDFQTYHFHKHKDLRVLGRGSVEG